VFKSFTLLVLMTMLRASAYSLSRQDLKNVVALSTLSQLRLIFIILGLGQFGLGLAHLLLHALFKSALFIGVGVRLHTFGGSQDFRDLKA